MTIVLIVEQDSFTISIYLFHTVLSLDIWFLIHHSLVYTGSQFYTTTFVGINISLVHLFLVIFSQPIGTSKQYSLKIFIS